MDLKRACHIIGKYLAANGERLYQFALEDTIGGYHEDQEQCAYPCGSIWGVEGQILYALVRLLRPAHLLEIGNFMGCSTAHIGSAMTMNQRGFLDTFDLYPLVVIHEAHQGRINAFTADLWKYDYNQSPPYDFLFLDDFHSTKSTAFVWDNFMEHAAPGAVIVTHDSEHETAGPQVKAGIGWGGYDYLSLVIEPSTCGLAIGRKP